MPPRTAVLGLGITLALALGGPDFAAAQGMAPGWPPAYWLEPTAPSPEQQQAMYQQAMYQQAAYPQGGAAYASMGMGMPRLSPVPPAAYIIPPPAPPQPYFQAPSPPQITMIPPPYVIYSGFLPIMPAEELTAIQPAKVEAPKKK